MTDAALPAELAPDELLAAEYVLGVLTADARIMVERRMAVDTTFAHLVDDWIAKLMPMEAATAAVMPPGRVKLRIDAALFSAAAQTSQRRRRAGPLSLLDSLAFWRWTAAFSLFAAVMAVSTMTWNLRQAPPQQPPEQLLATLLPQGAPSGLLAKVDAQTGLVRVEGDVTLLGETDGRSAELWVIGDDETPRSLGLIAMEGVSEVRPAPGLLGQLLAGAILAVSLEPEGGSRTGAPTGPIVALGALRGP